MGWKHYQTINKDSNERSRAVWSECKNGEGEWGETRCGRVRLARFTREDHAFGASRLPQKSENDCFCCLHTTVQMGGLVT